MSNFLLLFFSNFYPKMFGYFVKFILKFKNIKIGKNFSAFNFPIIIVDKTSQIIFGDNVKLFGVVEVRATRGSKVYIYNDVKIDKCVRILVTNNSTLKIKDKTGIGAFTIINSGDDCVIGTNCMISSSVQIQCSSHNFDNASSNIVDQGYSHKKITIGDDVWIGSKATILMGSVIKNKVVIGAHSLVKGTIEEKSVVAGTPAKLIKKRIS